MKRRFPFLFVIGIIAAGCLGLKTSRPDPWRESKAFQQWCRFTFHSDSGYISGGQNGFLLQLTMRHAPEMFTPEYIQDLTDDSVFAEKNLVHLDTFPKDSSGGKFYRVQLPGNVTRWMLCALFPSSFDAAPYVFEILEKDGVFSVNDLTMFVHGKYYCDESEAKDLLCKVGDWFFVNICDTGTAFCCCQANVLFFPFDVQGDSIPKTFPVPVCFFNGMLDGTQTQGFISSQFYARGDTIFGTYHYQMDSTLFWNDPLIEDVQKTVQQGHFTAVMKIDTANRTVKLLNEKEIRQIKGIGWVFEASSY